VLGGDGVVGAVHRVLDVAEHGIDPDEGLAALAPLRAADDQRFMGATRLGDGGKARLNRPGIPGDSIS
jgi:hypothetical protein